MGKTPINIGDTFGRLIVVKENIKKNRVLGCLCVCLCKSAKEIFVTKYDLRRGHTRSCGCIQKELLAERNKKTAKHNMIKSPTYRSWSSMLTRVFNKNHIYYKYYGGRGIGVCKEWLEFLPFYMDMGERPKGKTLDRINSSMGYSKENCRWATPKQQAENRKNTRWVKIGNKVDTITNWSKKLGIARSTISHRIEKNIPIL